IIRGVFVWTRVSVGFTLAVPCALCFARVGAGTRDTVQIRGGGGKKGIEERVLRQLKAQTYTHTRTHTHTHTHTHTLTHTHTHTHTHTCVLRVTHTYTQPAYTCAH